MERQKVLRLHHEAVNLLRRFSSPSVELQFEADGKLYALSMLAEAERHSWATYASFPEIATTKQKWENDLIALEVRSKEVLETLLFHEHQKPPRWNPLPTAALVNSFN